MFRSIYNDVINIFRTGNMVNKIILINIGVWLLINILFVFTRHAGSDSIYYDVLHYTAVPSEFSSFIRKPWTIVTHMFLHKGIWHLAWNMLLFYWFGKIVGDLIGDQKILPLFLYGGFFGAIVFIVFMQGSIAMGASAAVMAIVIAAAIISPDYIMRLVLIGEVKIKYIALAIVVLDIFGTAGNVNTGGHYAHLGGALFGWIYISLMRNGMDLSESFNRIPKILMDLVNDKNKPKKSPLTVRYKADPIENKKGNQATDKDGSFDEELNRILDKIKREGYEELTEEEKDFLYQASKK